MNKNSSNATALSFDEQEWARTEIRAERDAGVDADRLVGQLGQRHTVRVYDDDIRWTGGGVRK
jgi:hypothetical protein